MQYIFFSVLPNKLKRLLLLNVSDYFISLTAAFKRAYSYFRTNACFYVRSTFRCRTVSELHNSSQTLRFFVVHSALLLSSVYSARILGEFHPIRYKIYHPLNVPFHRFPVVLPTLHRVHTSHFTPPGQGGGFTSR